MANDKNDIAVKIRVEAKDAVNGTKKAKDSVVEYAKELKKLEKHFSSLSYIATKTFNSFKIVGLVKGIKSLTSAMINASQAQTDYIESLNLMDTAYGDVNNSGRKLIDTMNETIGLDQSGLTKTLGTYRQIADALGLANKEADKFSENLLKMTQDVSSLYNLTFEEASNKMISGITGQSRAVKVLGADITDAGLQQTAFNIGIEKSVSDMTQAEKTVLRYITLNHQLSNAQGDTAKTINEVANQTKIFKEQLAIAGRQIGAIFIPILKAILPVLNGVLMAFNTVVGTILGFFGIDAKSIAKSFGKSAKTISLGFDDIGASANKAGAAAKEALKQLRGFDKLNTIKTPTESSGSGSLGSIGGGGGIDQSFLDALDDADWQMGEIYQKATKIRDKILEWLGFTQDTNGEWHFSHITLGTILTAIATIIGAYSGIKKVFDIFKSLGGLLGLGGAASEGGGGGIAGILGTIGGLITGLGTATLTALGVESVGTILGFATGLAEIAAVIGLIYAACELFEYDPFRNSVEWWHGQSEETAERIGTVHDSVYDLQATIDRFSYMGLEMSQDDYDAILDKIVSLKEAALTELDDWYTQELNKLDEVYPAEEDKQSESYKIQKQALQEHYQESKDQLDQYAQEYEAKFKEFYANDKKISTDERLELLDIQRKIDQWSIDALVANSDDKLAIQKEYEEKSSAQATYERIKELEDAKAKKDELLKIAQDTYKERAALIDIESKGYTETMQALNKERNDAINAATTEYEKFYSGWVNQNGNLAKYVDKSTGTVTKSIGKSFQTTEQKSMLIDKYLQGRMTFWEALSNGLEKDAMSFEANMKTALDGAAVNSRNYGAASAKNFADGWNSRDMNLKVPTPNGGNQSYNLNIKYKYNGGFLNSGDLFWANENGHPEMVGSIGGRTAVANNDQIVESISIGVARAMSSANSKTNVTIVAEGDTSGLLDFINFKQKEKNRQFGL